MHMKKNVYSKGKITIEDIITKDDQKIKAISPI